MTTRYDDWCHDKYREDSATYHNSGYGDEWKTVPMESLSTPIEQREKRLKEELKFAKEQVASAMETRDEAIAKWEANVVELAKVKDQLKAKKNNISRMKKIHTALREKIERLSQFNRFEVMDIEDGDD